MGIFLLCSNPLKFIWSRVRKVISIEQLIFWGHFWNDPDCRFKHLSLYYGYQVCLIWFQVSLSHTHTQSHTCLMALCPGLPGWAGTRKVKPVWISLKQETVSSSGISWAVCKSAHRCRQITMPARHHSVFYRPDALPAAQPTASKHWSLSHSTVICNE